VESGRQTVVLVLVVVAVTSVVVFVSQGGCLLVMPVKLAPHVHRTGAYSFINGGSSVGWLLKGGCQLMDPNANEEEWDSEWNITIYAKKDQSNSV